MTHDPRTLPGVKQAREILLDDGSDWFNLACTRIATAMVGGIIAIVIVAEICRG